MARGHSCAEERQRVNIVNAIYFNPIDPEHPNNIMGEAWLVLAGGTSAGRQRRRQSSGGYPHNR